MLSFKPLNHDVLRVTAVGELDAEQVATISAPFDSLTKPSAVATLEQFSVTVDASGVSLPEAYRLLVFVWVKGKAAELAVISYNPVPARPLKSGLWRLAPDVTGGSADNASAVTVTLPRAYPVVRLTAQIRGLFES